MKKNPVRLLCFILLFFVHSWYAKGQKPVYGGDSKQRSAIVFNVGQYLVNEVNLGFEHLFSERKGWEIGGGLIYQNDILKKQAENWSNTQYFYERGFSFRLNHKIYHAVPEKGKRRNYHAFGVDYQYLRFNNTWFDTEKNILVVDTAGEVFEGKEALYQHRFRHRIGVQFTLGNVIPLGNTFGLEIYYGIGLRGIFSNRFDVARGVTLDDKTYLLDYLNYSDSKFYLRPVLRAGVKLRLQW